MKEETKITLDVIRYRDQENRPTCAGNFETDDVCIYYRTQRFGTHETCLFAGEGHRGLGASLQRRKSIVGNIPSNGTLIPIKECPIWKDILKE